MFVMGLCGGVLGLVGVFGGVELVWGVGGYC